MSEYSHHIEIEIGSEKNFGLVFAAVFTIIGLLPLTHGEAIRIWALIVAVIFFLLSFIAPKLLRVPNRLWHKFGLLLGAIIAPIAMGLVYFLSIAPIGLLMRLFGKDLLKQKKSSTESTYWIEREQPVGSMKNQF